MFLNKKFTILLLTCSLLMSSLTANNALEESEYVTLVVIVPESHADIMRKTLGEAGAGESDKYAFGSFSIKGTSRFIPKPGSSPYIGEIDVLETVIEERIETTCLKNRLTYVISEIKRVHPYEETVVDIYPIYKIGIKEN